VILEKGWRCLDCTFCEGCGQPHDEDKLILCDECDVSYHIYCVDPPLEKVPEGNWKCKWCAVCTECGRNDPGKNSSWFDNFSLCGPCSSLTQCQICAQKYVEREMIIQCRSCER
jgi:histone-lysine N-methyltransferase MLL3